MSLKDTYLAAELNQPPQFLEDYYQPVNQKVWERVEDVVTSLKSVPRHDKVINFYKKYAANISNNPYWLSAVVTDVVNHPATVKLQENNRKTNPILIGRGWIGDENKKIGFVTEKWTSYTVMISELSPREIYQYLEGGAEHAFLKKRLFPLFGMLPNFVKIKAEKKVEETAKVAMVGVGCKLELERYKISAL